MFHLTSVNNHINHFPVISLLAYTELLTRVEKTNLNLSLYLFVMIVGEYKELLEESARYAQQIEDSVEDSVNWQTGWYAGKNIGNIIGGTAGTLYGMDIGLEAADPVYEAVEATVPEAAPAVRVLGYSIPVAHAAITGVLAHEGGRVGLRLGKQVGRYYTGTVTAGIYATVDSVEQVWEFLDGETEQL